MPFGRRGPRDWRALVAAGALTLLGCSAPAPTAAPAVNAVNVPPPGIPPLTPQEEARLAARASAAPKAATAAAPVEPAAVGAPLLSGTVDVPAALRSQVTAGETVFVSVRKADAPGAAGNTVLAVQKLTAGSWPLPFAIHDRDVMIEGTTLTGEVVVVAWADHDGDPMTKGAGDLLGRSAPVRIPAQRLQLQLSEEPK